MFRNRIVLFALCMLPLVAISAQEVKKNGEAIQKESAEPIQKKNEPVAPLQAILDKHYQTYHDLEYFSGIQASIKVNDKLNTYTVGHRSHDKKIKLSNSDLFQIGSITKSFTAAIALIAEKEGQIELKKPVKDYLTAYPNWQNLSLTSLLNMTSGLPNYSDSPKINIGFADNIKRFWNRTELMDLVYTKDFNPPLRPGYNYTNTGYVLLDTILTERGQNTFTQLLNEKIIKPLNLTNTFYPIPSSNTEVNKRLISGYGYNVYDNPELVGRDVRENNLSWAGAAGGLVSNSEDVIHWANALFLDDTFLSKEQKAKMQSLISVTTGKPIKRTSNKDPRGFGLGVIQNYDKKIGRYWFYEGETLGYRSLYMIVPCKKITISALINSATNGDNDHSGELMVALYQQVIKDNPQLNKRCS